MENKSCKNTDYDRFHTYNQYDNSKVEISHYSGGDIEKDETKLKFFNDKLSKIETYTYADAKNWEAVFTELNTIYLPICILVLIISCSVMNKERKDNCIELIFTTQKGINKLSFIKFLVTIISCLMIAGIIVLTFMSYGFNKNEIGDSSMYMTQTSNIMYAYNYGQMFIITMIQWIVSIISLSSIGILLSTFVKSRYISITLGLVFGICINIFLHPIFSSAFIPLNFMMPYLSSKLINLFSFVQYAWIIIPSI